MADAGAGAARGDRIRAAYRHRGVGQARRTCGTRTIAPMIRVVVFLVLTAAFAKYVAVWLADPPGGVSITLLGYHAEPPIRTLIPVIACAAGLLGAVCRLCLPPPR